MIRFHAIAALVIGATAMAVPTVALAKKKPPPVVAAPAPPPTPMRPIPPNGAVLTMPIPPVDAMGVRQTVNTHLTPAQMTWNLRSALNVAALNCLEPRYAPVLEAYKVLLKKHAKSLAATSRAVDREFRDKYGTSYQTQRDIYNTQVYNYFALPPARLAFCDAALTISNEMLQSSSDLTSLAAQSLPRFEQAFDTFYRSFEQFRVDAAAWDAKYGQYFGYTLPHATALVPGSAPLSAPDSAAAMGTPMLVVPQPQSPAPQTAPASTAVPSAPVAPSAPMTPGAVPVTATGNPPQGG